MSHGFQYFEQMSRQSQTALYLYIDIETIPSQDPAVLDAIRAKHVVADVDPTAIEADKRLTDPVRSKMTSRANAKRLSPTTLPPSLRPRPQSMKIIAEPPSTRARVKSSAQAQRSPTLTSTASGHRTFPKQPSAP